MVPVKPLTYAKEILETLYFDLVNYDIQPTTHKAALPQLAALIAIAENLNAIREAIAVDVDEETAWKLARQHRPDEIFTHSELARWAKENGFEEAA